MIRQSARRTRPREMMFIADRDVEAVRRLIVLDDREPESVERPTRLGGGRRDAFEVDIRRCRTAAECSPTSERRLARKSASRREAAPTPEPVALPTRSRDPGASRGG
jgi:hypothetical protein